jgi:hypothetical protein
MTTEAGEHAVQVPALDAEWLPPLEARVGTLTGAEDDRAATRHFLSEYRTSPQTLRRYASEIGRLFCGPSAAGANAPWQLTRAGYDACERFLADPQPRALWCGPVRPREAPDWRPFVGGSRLCPCATH